MKNTNYNLVKMLLGKLDDGWRVERHYAGDATKSGCKSCAALLKKILADDKRHAKMLRDELAKHVRNKKFD
ncbi:MAG: hypothetical protein PHT12_04330 [Patescibacteria group bacterium]|nr:hypothetical protein [Patescibacteria group bacterium]